MIRTRKQEVPFMLSLAVICFTITSPTSSFPILPNSRARADCHKRAIHVLYQYSNLNRKSVDGSLKLNKPNDKNEIKSVQNDSDIFSSISRRDLFVTAGYWTSNTMILLDSWNSKAHAQPFFQSFSGRIRSGGTSGTGGSSSNSADLYAITPDTDASVGRGLIAAQPELLTSELCLLRLLPVPKKQFLRELQTKIEAISNLKQAIRATDDVFVRDSLWSKTRNATTAAISDLDRKRVQLEPVFIPDEITIIQIKKNERFEALVEQLRTNLVHLAEATQQQRLSETLRFQKLALLSLSEIGELLVPSYPYKVPTEGKYSYLPRLLGRAKVTFTIRRQRDIIGDITIVADGYAAPITAGNFIDLCERNFYTGLPIKFSKRRVGSLLGSDFDIVNFPVMGSYNEGFYDPLTAKLRKLPLELIRVDNDSLEQDLTYTQGLSSLSSTSEAVLEPTQNSKPLLSFRIPGLVAMNHPDRNPNGASSEFFCLQKDSMAEEKRTLLDGEYAPFGFIIDGLDLFQTLQANDIIERTLVDEWGLKYLVKLRKSSFTEVVQGADAESI